jgi:hypothetical protein
MVEKLPASQLMPLSSGVPSVQASDPLSPCVCRCSSFCKVRRTKREGGRGEALVAMLPAGHEKDRGGRVVAGGRELRGAGKR